MKEKIMFLKRNISEKLLKALKRAPVVFLKGARQSGKTTLMKRALEGYSYTSFDDLKFLSAAKNDPIGFIANLRKPAILDEVQRVPELFLAIKNYVDLQRSPGIFALTGSANPLIVPHIGDSLAGRIELIELFPLSQGEKMGRKERFIDKLFSEQIHQINPKPLTNKELCHDLVFGGFPSTQKVDSEGLYAWINSYLTTVLEKDITDLSKVDGLSQFPNLLSLLATRAGSLLNLSELSRSSGIANVTLSRYVTLLEALFLIIRQKPWHKNLGKRLVKSQKLYLSDSALLLYLLKADQDRLSSDQQIFGKVFENFVITELIKQCSWQSTPVEIYYYRTQTGIEVDAVLENMQGKMVGVEIKSGETVISDDFKGLRHIKEGAGNNFVCGVVLYSGTDIVPFGDRLWALPVSCLWTN